MSAATIILAKQTDAFSLAEIHRLGFAAGLQKTWSEDDFSESLKSKNNIGFIASLKGEDIGFILVQQVIDESEIISFAVKPQWQKKGHASKLLTHAIGQLKANNIRKIFLDVREDNEAAINIYYKFGFLEIGCRKKYYHLTNNKCRDAKVLELVLQK